MQVQSVQTMRVWMINHPLMGTAFSHMQEIVLPNPCLLLEGKVYPPRAIITERVFLLNFVIETKVDFCAELVGCRGDVFGQVFFCRLNVCSWVTWKHMTFMSPLPIKPWAAELSQGPLYPYMRLIFSLSHFLSP